MLQMVGMASSVSCQRIHNGLIKMAKLLVCGVAVKAKQLVLTSGRETTVVQTRYTSRSRGALSGQELFLQ
ncbi:acyltransferase-like protein chloroplastic [Dorcoceras hygrometricum]|uniref:Acyltransferase-like protein chloroplastic n=1 Tax=Dorcoceras hygrometricum TaxID=472368 RepID=A0A2Z7CPA8_9LAMI|nr:acyltransferase-like protein chloroplastic [Dorcoceras hygrometricum]